MKKYQQELEPGKFYHIFNRGNNSGKIFFGQDNYEFFLRRYFEYLSGSVETYAFCLLPNHFHFLVRVKESEMEAAPALAPAPAKALRLKDAKLFAVEDAKPFASPAPDPSKAFHRLFTSYSKAINKQQNRHGSLIENPFKRAEVDTDDYLTNLVVYIHTNPRLHGFVDDFRTYKWSSYNEILNDNPTRLQKDIVLDWFNDKENFKYRHQERVDLDAINEFAID